jgi:hypothetical protein
VSSQPPVLDRRVVLTQCRLTAERRLVAAIEPMLDAIAAQLNDLGQHAKDREERDSLFQCAGRLQSNRPAFLEGFRKEFLHRFENYAKALQGSGSSRDELDREAAAMLKTNVLENEVAVIRLSVKLKSEANPELAELSHRLVTLCRLHTLDDGHNPLGPVPIAHAMYAGLAHARVEGSGARALRPLMEAKLGEPVRELYRALNQLLQSLGIEPAPARPAPKPAATVAPPPQPAPVPADPVAAMPAPSDHTAAARAVAAAIAGVTLPPPVEAFLKQDWLGLLARTHAAKGPAGAPWREAVTSLHELVWSLKPKADPAERAKLHAALPAILRRITVAMDAMDMAPADRKPVLDALMAAHREILRPK